MNINNLLFFDRNGESYNFTQDSNGVWSGADYFLPISTALYDVSNIFIIEKTSTGYAFPAMAPDSKITASWRTGESSESFFLFTVTRDQSQSDAPTYLNKQTSVSVNYSDFGQIDGLDLHLSYPLQINVAFSPVLEKSYSRILDIEYSSPTINSVKIASIQFYGEGEDEDERLRVWLNNFGIKFNKEDALILKDYDLNEGLPDWKQLNSARKQLLVNRDQVYPYIGTYKGMMNLIDLLGYKDVLRVKEYWRDTLPSSRYYNNFALVDVTDLMTLGGIDSVNLLDINGQIKRGGKFAKTEMLALVYEFSEASTTTYDEYGMPEVVFTTDFTVDEIFYKLNRLADKLKTEILPVNVVIKDIIGEFIYFERLNIRVWQDTTLITALEINDTYQLKVNQPNQNSQRVLIRDIKTLYPSPTGSSFPVIQFNTSNSEPYQDGQQYQYSDIPNLIQAIQDYYTNANTYDFFQHGTPNPINVGDDNSNRIGCPVVLEAYLPDITLGEFTGSQFGDFDGTNYSIAGLRYRSGYEIEWNIIGPLGYTFTWRGTVPEIIAIPHFLPHPGTYSITATVYNLQGAASVSRTQLIVEGEEPAIEVFVKLQDKQRYQFRDLANVTIDDLGSSPLYLPFANVINTTSQPATLPGHYLDFNTYLNNFGIGGPQQNVQIYTDGIGFEPISTSANDVKVLWGTGSILGQPTLDDYGIATIGELSLNRLSDFSYVADRINGFYIKISSISANLTYLNFLDGTVSTDFTISSYANVDSLCAQLNASTNPQVSSYNYTVINGDIHAQAFSQNKSLNRIILSKWSDGINRTIYTFCYPSVVYTPGLINSLNSQLSQVKLQIDEDLLFLTAPFNDILRKTGEVVYSNTSLVVPSGSTSLTFNLTSQAQFTLASQSLIKASSISNPNNWVEGSVFSQPDLSTLILTVTGYAGSGSTVSDWQFDYVTHSTEVPVSNANASTMNYWLSAGYAQAGTSGFTGFLPSNYDQNTFNLQNIKIGLDAAVLPLNHPIFAAVSNIESKSECIWTLTRNSETVVIIKSPSYFIWRFDEPGDYQLSVQVTDSRGNVYTTVTPFTIGHAKIAKDYKKYVEESLTLRKNLM